MPTIGIGIDISSLVQAAADGNTEQIKAIGTELLHRGAPAAELIGRTGVVAARADSDGQAILTLSAAAILSRWASVLPKLQGEEPDQHIQELPLLVQALTATSSTIRAGQATTFQSPEPYFPSDLPEGKQVGDAMHDAIYGNDPVMIERLLLGLHGTGADYRTIEIRTYDGIATTFQNGGHPILDAVRGFQLLDVVEWGDNVPTIVHWLSPHVALHTEEADWVKEVRVFNNDPGHSLASLRVRIAAPKDESALPLRDLLLSDANTTQICQGVYDALIKGGASPIGVGSVIALAAADILQKINDNDYELFVRAAHGLLVAAAIKQVFTRVQDVEALPMLFTSAAYVNSLRKELGQAAGTASMPSVPATPFGGGLIAPAILENLQSQLQARDVNSAYSTARRYLRLDNDIRALFATIGLTAAQGNIATEQDHTFQIIQAAGEEFMSWPRTLNSVNVDGFLQIALRAAAFANRTGGTKNV